MLLHPVGCLIKVKKMRLCTLMTASRALFLVLTWHGLSGRGIDRRDYQRNLHLSCTCTEWYSLDMVIDERKMAWRWMDYVRCARKSGFSWSWIKLLRINDLFFVCFFWNFTEKMYKSSVNCMKPFLWKVKVIADVLKGITAYKKNQISCATHHSEQSNRILSSWAN